MCVGEDRNFVLRVFMKVVRTTPLAIASAKAYVLLWYFVEIIYTIYTNFMSMGVSCYLVVLGHGLLYAIKECKYM